jgi:hypothetical protein
MLTLNCPTCRRSLMLADQMAGSWMNCPGCKASFQVPAAAPPPLAEPVEVAPEDEPISEPLAGLDDPSNPFSNEPAGAFDFQQEERDVPLGVRFKLDGAAAWLKRTFLLDGLAGVLLCASFFLTAGGEMIFGNVAGAARLAVVGFLIVLFFGIPLPLLFLGAYNMSRQRFYGLALTAGILSLLVAVKSLLLSAWIAWTGFFTIGFAVFSPPILLLVFFMISAMICGFVAGVKTLVALCTPQVREVFR